MSETIFGIRIPKDLRDEMAKFEVNWSEYLSESIDGKLKELKKKKKKIAEHMDSIRKKTAGKNINMAKEIIEWRKKQ